jgi:hypothetical protein
VVSPQLRNHCQQGTDNGTLALAGAEAYLDFCLLALVIAFNESEHGLHELSW